MFPAWQRAVSLLLDYGLDEIERHDQLLVDRLIDGLPDGWALRSPAAGPERSTLVFLEPDHPDSVEQPLQRLNTAGIDVQPAPEGSASHHTREQHASRHRPGTGRNRHLNKRRTPRSGSVRCRQ